MEKLPEGITGFIASKVLSPKICSHIIAQAESVGFHDKSAGPMFAGDRLRATFTHAALAERLWTKIAPYCRPYLHDDASREHSFIGPDVSSGWYDPVGINPFIRVSKYLPGQSFRKHTDTAYSKGEKYVGMHTLLLYLNGDMTGGETIVDCHDKSCTVKPETGRVLVFYHYTPHEGAIVESGVKYVVRAEIMFRKR